MKNGAKFITLQSQIIDRGNIWSSTSCFFTQREPVLFFKGMFLTYIGVFIKYCSKSAKNKKKDFFHFFGNLLAAHCEPLSFCLNSLCTLYVSTSIFWSSSLYLIFFFRKVQKKFLKLTKINRLLLTILLKH